MIEIEKDKLVEQITPDLWTLAQSKEGLKLALTIVNYSNEKLEKIQLNLTKIKSLN